MGSDEAFGALILNGRMVITIEEVNTIMPGARFQVDDQIIKKGELAQCELIIEDGMITLGPWEKIKPSAIIGSGDVTVVGADYEGGELRASAIILQGVVCDAEPERVIHLRDMRVGETFQFVENDNDIFYRLTERLTLEVRARALCKLSDWSPVYLNVKMLGNPRVWPVMIIENEVKIK